MITNAEACRRYAEKYPERKLESVRKYQAKYPERVKEQIRKTHERDPWRRKNNKLKHLYGITLVEYEAKRLNQQNKCAVCKKDFTGTPFVDHDHVTNSVRDLLCNSCNSLLGYAKDDVSILMFAIEYLKKHQGDLNEIT